MTDDNCGNHAEKENKQKHTKVLRNQKNYETFFNTGKIYTFCINLFSKCTFFSDCIACITEQTEDRGDIPP